MKTLPLAPAPAKTMKKEYSGLECTVEVVRTTEEAIDHIHKFGSSHTDVIITDNGNNIVLNLSLHLSVIRVLLISLCVATIFARVVRRQRAKDVRSLSGQSKRAFDFFGIY